jgi:hypothetical protein
MRIRGVLGQGRARVLGRWVVWDDALCCVRRGNRAGLLFMVRVHATPRKENCRFVSRPQSRIKVKECGKRVMLPRWDKA